MFILSHGGSTSEVVSLVVLWVDARTYKRFLIRQVLSYKEHRVLCSSKRDGCDILPVGQGGQTLIKTIYNIRMVGLPFRCSIEITQNATRGAKE